MNTSMQLARFTVAYWCVLVAALLPIVCAWIAKQKGFGKPRREGGFDNHNPRQWLATLQGLPAQAGVGQQREVVLLRGGRQQVHQDVCAGKEGPKPLRARKAGEALHIAPGAAPAGHIEAQRHQHDGGNEESESHGLSFASVGQREAAASASISPDSI